MAPRWPTRRRSGQCRWSRRGTKVERSRKRKVESKKIKLKVRVACTIAVLTTVAGAAVGQTDRAPRREIENVAAFAQLYGVVRFFYPSDAAASLDWGRFAVDGVARVRTARDANALASQLRALFVP